MKLSRVPRELPRSSQRAAQMTQAEPFDFGDLPENISRQFRLKIELDAGFVLVYPR